MGSHNKVLFCYLVAATALLIGATAETHTVGNDIGWNVPPGGSIAYRTWADTRDFGIGDTVVFQWSNTHDVAQVSQTEYDNCAATNPIGGIHTTSPYNFTINSTDPYYFMCSVSNHCSLGQKVKIQVGAAASSLTTSAYFTLILAMAIYFSNLM
ncbi:hypothetical protein ACH5RR_004341 [Cinchona calisaya]|uniref:Phytocyanin domain-containing protein n=1 Tax=Cinchona calisaya TaxID=153742 RepID=A0ABD3AXN2_9GENT